MTILYYFSHFLKISICNLFIDSVFILIAVIFSDESVLFSVTELISLLFLVSDRGCTCCNVVVYKKQEKWEKSVKDQIRFKQKQKKRKPKKKPVDNGALKVD